MAVKLTIHPPRENSPQIVEFNEDRVTIGRSSKCDIRLPFRVVSGHHLTIHNDGLSGFQVRDEASTNGTSLDGEPLPAGEDRRLISGAELEIVDLRITVELVPTLGDGFSLDKTGTMVRQMVGEALLTGTDSQDDERAYFEVLQGANRGRCKELPDDLDRGIIADELDAAIYVEGLEARVEIYRDGDGFAVGPAGDDRPARPVTLDDRPLSQGRRLTSGDVLRVGSTELEFIDPLESYLAELDGLVPAASSTDHAAALADEAGEVGEAGEADGLTGADALEADGSGVAVAASGPEVAETLTGRKSPESVEEPPGGSAWGLLEISVVLVSLVLLLGVGYLLASIFGLL